MKDRCEGTYNRGSPTHSRIGELVDHIDLELVVDVPCDERGRIDTLRCHGTTTKDCQRCADHINHETYERPGVIPSGARLVCTMCKSRETTAARESEGSERTTNDFKDAKPGIFAYEGK